MNERMRITNASGAVDIGTTSAQTGYILNAAGGTYSTQTSNSAYGAVYGTNSGTGSGYGEYGAMTGHANTGYAGFFTNTGTGAINYGLYATTSSTTGWAGYFQGNIYISGTMTLASDRSLKENIKSLILKQHSIKLQRCGRSHSPGKKPARRTWASSRRKSATSTRI